VIEIVVELGARRYPIQIGHGVADKLPELLAGFRGRRLVVVSDPRVWSLHGARVERGLRRLGPLARVLVPEGEAHKSWASVARLHDAFVAAGLPRDGLVVAFGGGVVGDVAGFAAATYMRGVDLVQLPTTLLAMLDSSIGGKVGVNHPRAKNLVGAFHQPRAVVCDPGFLETLPIRELRSGAYEALKCALIADRELFEALQRAPRGLVGWQRTAVENTVAAAARIKAGIVERDEREMGLRRVLNLGHTLGHALEAATRYRRFSHGEAVGWGMLGAGAIACKRGLLTQRGFDTLVAALDQIGPRPPVSDVPAVRIFAAAGRDKKARAGKLTFVLPVALGRVVLRNDVSRAELRRALRVMASHEARRA
jgi:3-dehydroquinate synthase